VQKFSKKSFYYVQLIYYLSLTVHVMCLYVQEFAYCSMAVLSFGIGLVVVAYAIYCVYMQYVKKRCSCKTDLTGKTVIITGSDKGECMFSAVLISA